jgi:hypothetical protein
MTTKPDNIIQIKKIDIEKLKSLVNCLSNDDWNSWEFRQTKFSNQKNTKTYPLIWSHGIENNTITVIRKNKIWVELLDLIEYLTERYNGTVVKCMFTKLLSNKNIEEHCDLNELVLCHRIHIPIITNNQVIFYINKIPFFLEEGKVYEINNQKNHSVENNSNIDRVHLIVDILPFSKNINVCYEGF